MRNNNIGYLFIINIKAKGPRIN